MKQVWQIDPEFRLLSVPLSLEEENRLENSLLREGCREPIVVWHGCILDGHKRYEICSYEEMDYKTVEMNFVSREDAIIWICKKRVKESSADKTIYKYLVGKWYNAEKTRIPIRNLVSNQEYQRPLSENHIRKALEEFDVYQINPVKVSRRDGINYVFDGQHTIEIIASESGSRDTPVWCMIYDDLKYKEEAHIFADQQKHVKALSSFETFKAHIEADDPKQKMIEAIVQSYGLAITSTKAKNGISAVSTLERIYDKYGQAVLDRTLRLAAATWEGENNSFSGNILMGIARIVVAYGDTVRDDVFKDHVGRVSVKAIIRAAKERRPGALGYSEAMIIEYNKKSKFRLSLKTLYGGKAMSGEDDFGEE